MFSSLFPSRRRKSVVTGKRRHLRRERLHLQTLEQRMALAIDVFQYPVAGVSSGSSNYAVLVMDDGATGFLKKNATPSPTFTYATNSQFLDDPLTPAFEAYTFGELLASAGTLSSFYVTSGKRVEYVGPPISAAFPGKTTFIANVDPAGGPNPIDIGNSDGIVPGTFLAFLSVVDKDGKSASATLLASKPGDRWNLSIERTSGDGALPNEGNVIETTGDVILRGWSDAPQSVDLRPLDWAVYTGARGIDPTLATDPKPLSLTLFPGQTVTQRFLADLSRNESTISINSPLLATRGSSGDPGFFSGAGDVRGQVGQVVLDGSTIVTNANVSSADLFTVCVPLWVNAVIDPVLQPDVTTRIPVDTVSINRPVSAPKHQLIVEGAVGAPGLLLVGEQGAIADSLTSPTTSAAQVIDIQALHTDVILAGPVNANQQTYLFQSPLDTRSYTLTTVSPTSGTQTGRILGDTVGITLANDAGGEVNVRTTIDNLRMTAASTLSEPALPYAITVTESDDLVVDAVPASRRPIVLDVAGTLSVQSSVQTTGSLILSARNQLNLTGAMSSAAGDVLLVSDSVTSTGPITAGGTRGVSLQSRTAAGDVVLNGLVRAGGVAKAPVRAASTADIDLVTGGLLTVDGVALVAGDRVLVKNQANPAANGVYVADAGPWLRATDANTSQLLLPGFTVAVGEGNQQGVWAFGNAVVPTLEQTGLAFVPASAVQTYVPARVATTTSINLAAGGLLVVDGVTLAAGDRVLVMNQANARQNGLYVAGPGAWVRAADANTTAELVAGSYVFVTEGTANGQKGFVLTDDAVQVGNTPLTFAPFIVQPNRTNTYSPARVLTTVVAATTVHVDLAAPPAEIDGVTLILNDLVLVKNQFDASTNGVYVYGPAGLQRWSGADASSELPRGATVFVAQGATNADTSWTFNDTINLLGRTTAGSLFVTDLPSTLYLSAGMPVTGPGIPANTVIDLVVDSTSVRLTKSALVGSSTAALGFMQTSPVAVGTTPILFVPTGGTAVVTAGDSIRSSTASPSSRIMASTAVLTAGRPTTGSPGTASFIDVNSAVGRITAAAPADIDLSDSGAIDLLDVRTQNGGAVSVEAQGTVTARFVKTSGSSSTPADVAFTSVFGDVVAASVSAATGTVAFTSVNERVVLRRLGLNDASVIAEDGDVIATANVGGLWVEGAVQAGGTDGDITFQSNLAGLSLAAPATLQATDRLTVTTPAAVTSIGAGVTVSAAALSITSQFGSAQSLPAGLGSFTTIDINRTDPGSLAVTSPVGLVVEGVTTVQGDISVVAPSLQVTGPITSGSSGTGAGAVRLVATAADIDLAAPITAIGTRVTLDASAGVIRQTAGLIDSLTLVWYATVSPFPGLNGTFRRIGSNLTAPGSLTLGSATAPIVIVGASTVSGTIDIIGSSVRIVDTIKANGGDAVNVTAALGGIEFVSNTLGGIVTLPSGSVALSAAAGSVVATNKSSRTTVRGGTLTVNALAADLKCNVSSLTSTTTLGGLNATAVGGLTVAAINAVGQTVTLDAASGVSQTAPIAAGVLAVRNTSGSVILTDSSNDFSTVSVSNGAGNVALTTIGSLAVAGSGISTGSGATPGDGDIALTSLAGTIGLNAPVTAGGDRVTLDARLGSIQGSGAITSQTLVWYAATLPALSGSFVDIGSNLTAQGNLALNVLPSQRLLATSTVDGSITITGSQVTIAEPVTAGGNGGVAVAATVGDIVLQPAAGALASIAAPNGTVSLSASTGRVNAGAGSVTGLDVSVVSGGSVAIGRMVSTGTTTITTTTAGGGVDVGPQGGSLLQAGGALDLRNVQGSIVIRNGGLILGNPLLLAPGKSIQFGGAITTAADLASVVSAVNALPVIPGSTYDILIGASMTLTQTLTVDRPVTFRGTSTSIVLSGSPSVTTGLVLNSGASGSTVRSIAFSTFTGDAVRATSLSGLTVTGVKVMNSGTGIRLTSVTKSTIGGSAAGQGNVFQNCSVGIFATGVCSNTQLVKNTFPGTRTQYNVSSSRGITVVK